MQRPGQRVNIGAGGPIYLNLTRMKEWTISDVCNWLKYRFTFGSQYIERFESKHINGAILSDFDENGLKTELNVLNPIHVTRLYRDIVDSKRPVEQMRTILASCKKDGGTYSSKFMRFDNEDVCKFARMCDEPSLARFESVFRNYYLNGLALLQADERYLMQQCKIGTIRESHDILAAIWEVKTNVPTQKVNILVEKIWQERTRFDENDANLNMKFQLLPQHLVDWIQRIEEQKQESEKLKQQAAAQAGAQQQQQQQAAQQQQQQYEQAYPQPDVTRVLEWTNEDVFNWLAQLGRGGSHNRQQQQQYNHNQQNFAQRYGEHFRVPGIDGNALLNLTPWSLENVCGIHIKKHIREIITAIDRLRDQIIGRQFSNLPHVQEWVQKHPRRNQGQRQQQHQQHQQQQQYYNNQQQQGQYQTPVKYEQRQGQGQGGQAQQQQQQTPQGPPQCRVCGKTGDAVMRCSNCKHAFYCSRDHQV